MIVGNTAIHITCSNLCTHNLSKESQISFSPLLLWHFFLQNHLSTKREVKGNPYKEKKKSNCGSTQNIDWKEKVCVFPLLIQGDSEPTKGWKAYPEAKTGFSYCYLKGPLDPPNVQGPEVHKNNGFWKVPFGINMDQCVEQLLLCVSSPLCLS